MAEQFIFVGPGWDLPPAGPRPPRKRGCAAERARAKRRKKRRRRRQLVIRFPRKCSPLPRGVSLDPRRLTSDEREAKGKIEPDIAALLRARPRLRSDCQPGGDGPWSARPCPFALCKHHLYVDVRLAGALRLNFPGMDLEQLRDTCALDVADRGESEVNEIAELLNMSPERVGQLVAGALQEVRAASLRAEAAAAGRLYDIRRRGGG